MLYVKAMKVLVTGGTGFIGSHIARALADRGDDVTITGRNRYPASRTFHPKILFARADLRDRPAIVDLCEGQDVVVHCGALSSPWGAKRDFFAINLEGTRHVVAGCERAGVKRLVHVSSTSVFFEYTDKLGLLDNAPFAKRFCNDYAESKALAEGVVHEAVARGLDAIILRARAVFGPGDTTIIPRVLAGAESGRLRQIGDGNNVLDLTYVDNFVHATMLAMERGPKGCVLNITNDEPVELWPLLKDLIAKAGITGPLKPIRWETMHRIAALLEAVYARLPGRPEPPVTRYGAGLLAKTQTFDIAAAKAELGYAPTVKLHDGLARTLKHVRGRNEDHAPVAVKLRLLFTGHCTNWEHHVLAGAPRRKIPIHSMAAVIEHPQFGITLVDTGYAEHFFSETRRFPFNLYARVTPVTSPPHSHAVHQLAEAGIGPRDVARIVVTHFHGDHIAGLRDFPAADIVCTKDAWRSVRGRRGVFAVRKAHVPGLLPDDFEKRLSLLDGFADPGIGPFSRTHDLFGDGSVRLVPLPGHAAGQMGALVQTGPAERKLLVADAVWMSEGWRERRMPHPVTRFITASHRDYQESVERIHAFHAQFPDIEIIPTHCPEVFARWSQLASAAAPQLLRAAE